MTQAGSEPTIAASERQQTDAVERMATGMDSKLCTIIKILNTKQPTIRQMLEHSMQHSCITSG